MSAGLSLQVARNRAAMAHERLVRPAADRRQWELELAALEQLCDEPEARVPARQKVTPADMSEVARAMAWLATRPTKH